MASVRRLVESPEQVTSAAFMWRVHSRLVVFGLVVGTAAGVGAYYVAGFETPQAAAGIGLLAFAVAALATTEHRVLAETGETIVFCRGARTRQVAVELLATSVDAASIEVVSANAVTSEWRVEGQRFTVSRRHQQTMTRFATTSLETT